MASDTPTPTNVCTASCEAPTSDGIHLCRAHTTELVDALRAVPALVADLDVTITRQSRTAGPKHGARSTSTPLPWNEHASACRTELNAILNAWAYETAQIGEYDTDPLSAIHPSDTAELANWLRAHRDYAARHDLAGDLYAEVLDAITQATRAVDLPPERKFIGICKHAPDGGPLQCREDLYALPKQQWVTCRGCTHRHDAGQRRQEMLDELEDHAAHSGVLSSIVTGLGHPVGASTIRKWAADGRLTVVSVDSNRRKLYKIGEVLNLIHPSRAA